MFDTGRISGVFHSGEGGRWQNCLREVLVASQAVKIEGAFRDVRRRRLRLSQASTCAAPMSQPRGRPD